MNNAPAPQELINQYKETGSSVLALEIQKTIREMTPAAKLALVQEMDAGQTEVAAPPIETFEAGKPVVEKPPVINEVEIPETEVVVPPAVEAADAEILKEVEAVVPEVAEEDKKIESEIASVESSNSSVSEVDALAPVGFEQARERLLAGNSDAISSTECDEGEAAWYKVAT